MAKSLEEHLYRSAQTKEEYMNLSTLKKRLQMIAHGLELHHRSGSGSKNNDAMGQPQSQQHQLLLQMASGNLSGSGPTNDQDSGQQGNDGMMVGDNMSSSNAPSSMFPGNDSVLGNGPSVLAGGNSSKFQDPVAAQKKKVIRQQQQRLLLLRHASKCTAGPTCSTKFCAQMVTLWKHMKKCRDKNCSTSHCLSSRCVLNHYRICKSQGRTSNCDVCGPVMEQIKRQETGDEIGSADPLTQDKEMPVLDSSMPNLDGSDNMSSSSQIQQQQQGPGQEQLQQLQVAQMKLQNQLQVLKQLQRQQEQLLQQQRHLQEQQSHIKDPNGQQGQQLQQQQALLQQLQQRCQQQQMLLQQELALQSDAINSAKQKQANQAKTGAGEQANVAMPGKNLNSSSSSRRGSTTQRNPKSGKRKSGKGKAVREAIDKTLKEQKPSTPNSKRRLSIAGNGMPEAARKKIKLEPQSNNQKGDGQEEGKLVGEVDDDEAKKRFMFDDSIEDGGEPHVQPAPTMSRESIEKHLNSLDKPARISTPDEIAKHFLPLVTDLIDDPFGWVFRDRVDPEALGLPDYFEVVKRPMHLELVKQNLEDRIYSNVDTFRRDCSLVFENSILYNGESSEVGQLALTMLSSFADKFEAVLKGTDKVG